MIDVFYEDFKQGWIYRGHANRPTAMLLAFETLVLGQIDSQ